MNPHLISFTGLVSRYHPLLFRFARYIIRNEFAAKKIAIQSLVTLWSNRKGILTNEEARIFLKTTTRVLCHKWLYEQVQTLRQSGSESA